MKRFELTWLLLVVSACVDPQATVGDKSDVKGRDGGSDDASHAPTDAPDGGDARSDGGAAGADAEVPAVEPRAHVVFTSASERQDVPELWAAPLDELSQVRRLNPPIQAYDAELRNVLPVRARAFAVMTATLDQGAVPSLVAVRASDRMQLTLGSASEAPPQVLDDDATVVWLDHEGVVRAAELGAEGLARSWIVAEQPGLAADLVVSPVLRKAAYVRCQADACALWLVPDVDHPEPQLVHSGVNAEEVRPGFALDGKHLQYTVGFKAWLADASTPASPRMAQLPSASRRVIQAGARAAYYATSSPGGPENLWRVSWESGEAEQESVSGGDYTAVSACGNKIFVAAGQAGWVLDDALEPPGRPLPMPADIVEVEWLADCGSLLPTVRTPEGGSKQGPILEVEGARFGVTRELPSDTGWLHAFRRVHDGAIALVAAQDQVFALVRWRDDSATPETELLAGHFWPWLDGVQRGQMPRALPDYEVMMTPNAAEPGTWDVQTLRMPRSVDERELAFTKLAGPMPIRSDSLARWGAFSHGDWLALQGMRRDARGEFVWTTYALDLHANAAHDITPHTSHSRGGVSSVQALSKGRVLFTAAVDQHHFPELFSVDVERAGAATQQTSSERLRLLGAAEREPLSESGGLPPFDFPDPAVDYRTVLLADGSDTLAYLTQSGWVTQPLLAQGASFSADDAAFWGAGIHLHAFSPNGKVVFYSTKAPLQLWYEDLATREAHGLLCHGRDRRLREPHGGVSAG